MLPKNLSLLFLSSVLFTLCIPANAQDIATEISEMVKARSQYNSFIEYHESTHNLHTYLEKLRPITENECADLLQTLAAEDLIFLANEIEHSYSHDGNKSNEACFYKIRTTANLSLKIKRNQLAKDLYRRDSGIDSKARKKLKPILLNTKYETEYKVDVSKSPIYFTADLPKGVIALTFDDGPKRGPTDEILDALKAEGIRVSFFGVGKNIRKIPELVIRAKDEGHSYGTHSNNHKNLPKLSYLEAVKEIDQARIELENVLGFEFPFFRFPYGNRSKQLQEYVKSEKLATFFWNIDTLDWKITDPEKLYDHCVDQINQAQRGIVLFHDIQPQTAIVIPHLIKDLKKAGYQFVVFVP